MSNELYSATFDRFGNTVALRLNDYPTIYLSVADAKDLATTLNAFAAEVETVLSLLKFCQSVS